MQPPAFICPICHGSLQAEIDSWQCSACRRVYPVQNGIPDFLIEELNQEPASSSQRIRWMDRSMGWLSKIYESRFWYPFFINVIFGWRQTSLEQIANWMKESLPGNTGCLLDVACGPATYGRRLASSVESVYGIDVSLGMLRQGEKYLEQTGIRNVHLARSQAEQLPFREDFFDAAICAGSLHLFSQPERVLAEIQRSLKPGAPLAVMTLIHGEYGIVRYRAVRDYLLKGIRVFEKSELEEILARAGFSGFQARIFGSGIFFVTYSRNSILPLTI